MSFNPIQNANKSSFLDARVIEDQSAAVHQNCAKAPGGNTLSDGCLICLLPGTPRNITIQYFDDKQRDEALLSCSLLSHHIFPGWHQKECRDDKIRDLFVARTQDLVAQAAKRKQLVARAVTNRDEQPAAFQALNEGFWYANDYFMALKTLKQEARLQHYKKKNAFYHGLPPQGFSHVQDPDSPSGMKVAAYVLQRLTAVQGLISIRRSPCFIDCQELVEIAFYQTLLEVMGAKMFNERHQPDGSNALRLDPNIYLTPITPLLAERNTKKGKLGKRPVQKGEAVCFMNIPLYGLKHREGDASSFHAVCMRAAPSQKYLAFGLSPEGVAEETIIDTFVNCFNEKPLQATEMYSEDLAQRVSKSPRLDASAGMSVEDAQREANGFKLTRAKYLGAEAEYPDLVGYNKSWVVTLDSSKILKILQAQVS